MSFLENWRNRQAWESSQGIPEISGTHETTIAASCNHNGASCHHSVIIDTPPGGLFVPISLMLAASRINAK